jgi:hypothetical protein
VVSLRPLGVALVLGPLLLSFAWLLVVAPILEANVRGFGARSTPRRRTRLCRIFAWAPAAVFAVLCVQYAVVLLLDVEDFGWFDPPYGWLVAAAFVLSLVYGRMMSRLLERRVRDRAARAGVCFSCSYPLTGLARPACPECGWPTGAGDARGASPPR